MTISKFFCCNAKFFQFFYLNRQFILFGALLGLTSQAHAFSIQNESIEYAIAAKASALSSTSIIDCSNTINPLFTESTNILCLPIVEVPGEKGTQFYKAQLKLEATAAGTYNLTLLSIDTIPAAGSNNPLFTLSTGVLTIPEVVLPRTYGTERYKVTLMLLPNSNPVSFSLATIDAVISPNYQPGKTWKPYVGLLANEKEAINVLEQSQPFTGIAEAVYDFGTKVVGNWDLIQQTGKSSGMQAGLYRNRVSNELAIAFRGTELCLDPTACSFSQIEESGKDALTDTLLTQGHDSGQFDDAFNFARDVIKAYPNTKITVTGHSLGGGLAQAVGASFLLDTFAFNSSPVPNNFYNDHGIKQFDSNYAKVIHVLSDIHDPVSSTNHLGLVYADAAHVTPNLQFDFDKKEILPTYKTNLDTLRFNKHSMTLLRANITTVTDIYQLGW